MAFDSLFASALAIELNDKIKDSKVEKINQPSKDNVVLNLRCKGENIKLLISSNASCARISITEMNFENPEKAPMFTMLLRKHLQGSIIKKIDTLDFERIIRVYFASYDELSYPCTKILVCELMGKYSNIILIDENNRILGVNRPVDLSENRVRQILTGMVYSPPPKQDKIMPIDISKNEFLKKIDEYKEKYGKYDDDTLSSFIVKTFLGIAPSSAREIVYMAKNDYSASSFEERLYKSFSKFVSYCNKENNNGYIIKDESGENIDFSFMPLNHYDMKVQMFNSLSVTLERYYIEKEKNLILKSKIGNLENITSNAIKKATKKISNLETEIAESENALQYKKYGQLITSYLYMLKEKSNYCDVFDYEKGENVRVPLDEKLTPSQNANRYFKKYTKLKLQKENASIQIEKTNQELSYLLSIKESFNNCETNDDIVQIKEELISCGYIKQNENQKQKKKGIKFSPLIFKTQSGKTVRVGKNNAQNDYLSLKFSNKEDIWFHVKNAPGSHVVLENNGNEILNEDIVFCASLAAHFSSMKMSDNIPVDYTKIRYVKKGSNNALGHVIFTNYSTIYVKPYDYKSDANYGIL